MNSREAIKGRTNENARFKPLVNCVNADFGYPGEAVSEYSTLIVSCNQRRRRTLIIPPKA
jgi:hypothetical protein